MMHIWMLRSADRDHFRLEVDGHPGILQFYGWELREGELDEGIYQQLVESEDEVEIERLHQEIWSSLEPTTQGGT